MKVIGATGLWLVAFAVVTSGTEAAAQTPVQSFADLQPTLKVGQIVLITDDKGIVTRGTMVSILGNRLEVDGIQRPRSLFARFFFVEAVAPVKRYLLTEDSVRRIRNDDPTWNGALIGGGIGALLASVGYATAPAGHGYREVGPLPPIAGGALLGWICGTLIDDKIHRSLYVSRRAASVSLAPSLGPGRVAIAGTVRF